jgi:general nucleoside transport system permease protein
MTADPHLLGGSGVGLGLLAAWVALPPLELRTFVAPVLLGAVAVGTGVLALRVGATRPGRFAIAAGVLGAGLGILATHSSTAHLEVVVGWSALLAAMLRYATPLLFAAIGGMVSERSGVVNIGLEGMMLTGAFFGILGADKTGSWALGIVIGMVAGGGLALVYAIWAIHLRVDQIIGGTAMNFIALGLTGYLFVEIYGDQGTPAGISAVPDVQLSFLERSPFLYGAIGQLNLLTWIALALVALSSAIVFRTPLGLRLRAVGEHPLAAETVGVSVFATRYAAVVASGMLAAAGGAYLSIGFVNAFNQNMTAGRGFIALAALIFGKWRPYGAAGACLLFGFSTALAQRLAVYSQHGGIQIDVLFQALPYVLTLVAVAGVIGRSIPPAAVGTPYTRQ